MINHALLELVSFLYFAYSIQTVKVPKDSYNLSSFIHINLFHHFFVQKFNKSSKSHYPLEILFWVENLLKFLLLFF